MSGKGGHIGTGYGSQFTTSIDFAETLRTRNIGTGYTRPNYLIFSSCERFRFFRWLLFWYLMWRQDSIYPWCRVFDRPMPPYSTSESSCRVLPKMVAPGQKCRKCRTTRAKYMKAMEKLRYSLKVNFGKCNAKGETMSVSLVTSKKYYWFGVVWGGNSPVFRRFGVWGI